MVAFIALANIVQNAGSFGLWVPFSSWLTISGGAVVVVSLKSLSRKRHNGLSAYKNIDSTFVIRYFLS